MEYNKDNNEMNIRLNGNGNKENKTTDEIKVKIK